MSASSVQAQRRGASGMRTNVVCRRCRGLGSCFAGANVSNGQPLRRQARRRDACHREQQPFHVTTECVMDGQRRGLRGSRVAGRLRGGVLSQCWRCGEALRPPGRARPPATSTRAHARRVSAALYVCFITSSKRLARAAIGPSDRWRARCKAARPTTAFSILLSPSPAARELRVPLTTRMALGKAFTPMARVARGQRWQPASQRPSCRRSSSRRTEA